MKDRYEPGDVITVVGYTRGCVPSAVKSSTSAQRTLEGYLHRDPCDPVVPEPRAPSPPCARIRYDPPADPTAGIPLGPFTVEDTRHLSRGKRISLTFRLPEDLDPGAYLVEVCQDPCRTDGDRSWSAYGWPSPIYVGVDPPPGVVAPRPWPIDDPAIDDLPDDVLVYGPDGSTMTAAELRTTLQARAEAEAQAEADETDTRDRVETAAPHEVDRPDRGGDVLLWVGAAGLVGAAALVLMRLGSGRKQVHPKE